METSSTHVCPVWLAHTFDNPLRRFFHNPDKIFAGLVGQGETAVDIGCGLGYFSIALAHRVGDTGTVISVDLQQGMLDRLMQRAEKAGVGSRIRPHKCATDTLGLSEPTDFIITSWVAHEVPDKPRFFSEIRSLLKPSAHFLLMEPKFHVKRTEYEQIVEIAETQGLERRSEPKIAFSFSALFSMKGEMGRVKCEG